MDTPKYFTGRIFEQIANMSKTKNKKNDPYNRVTFSAYSSIGSLTEKFIREFFNSHKKYEVLELQKTLSLPKDHYLIRNTFQTEDKIYEKLKIEDLSNLKLKQSILINIKPRTFYKNFLKDVMEKNIKDCDDQKNFEVEVKNNIYLIWPGIKKIIENENSLIIYLNSNINQEDKERDLFFLKKIGLISNQKQTIKEDLFIRNKENNKKILVEVKSRAKSGLSKNDIYSTIYYPIYYNFLNPEKKIYTLIIYLGDIKSNIYDKIAEIKKNYDNAAGTSLRLMSFDFFIKNFLDSSYNLRGFQRVGFKVENNDKYKDIPLFNGEIRFILDYEYNLELELKESNSNNELQKEINRDSNNI